MTDRIDKLGAAIALLLCLSLTLPFATFRATRIAAGEGRLIAQSLATVPSVLLIATILLVAVAAFAVRRGALRLVAGTLALVALALSVGAAAYSLSPPDQPYVRIAPASGFWLAIFAISILLADALVRLKLGPLSRVIALGGTAIAIAVLLTSGAWSKLSLLIEYRNRADIFWREAGTHLVLAMGSLGSAIVLGLPLGILAHRVRRIRGVLLNVLNIIQTIPSMALFGILIAPLGWIAANVPLAHDLGIRGIGMAPAFVALFLYSLLPMVANVVVGLNGVPPAVVDAARGMGLTGGQRLVQVEIPLALPVVLTGIRIVLVQNIGLASIAGLIGGGGFGTFLFQGLNQTANDLILLGALPTVALAFAAAVLLDAVIEISARRPS